MSKRFCDGRIVKDVSKVKNHTKVRLDMSGPVVLLYRTRLGGWQPSPHSLMLNHQLYEMKVFSIAEKFDAKEIVAVNPASGEWETVWLKDGENPSRPESYRDTDE